MRLAVLVWLVACSGGDDATESEATETEATDTESSGEVWPGARWDEGDPADHGLDVDAIAALDAFVFQEANDSQALAIVKDGVLVYESYANGYDADSVVTSWSAAKSVTSALIGIGARDGLIDVEEAAATYLETWSGTDNDAITLRHLLQMQSGLSENTSNPYGIYLEEPDQLAYALDRELDGSVPGESFVYLNEDSMVLSGVVAEVYGQQAHEVAQTELFEPIGMWADWWTDGAGHALGYCCLDTTPRDFARFGLLFARGGEWDGAQIVPADYVEDATTGQAFSGYYGLHWWVNGETFAAIGLHGQYVWAWPAHDLVIVRFSRYTQYGEERVREGTAYSSTNEPGALDQGELLELFEAVVAE